MDSALAYNSKEAFEFDESGRYNAISDNYADVILLNIMWNIKSGSPVYSSLDTKYYDGEDYGENWGLYQSLNGAVPNTDYTRYWHGSVIFIRPLMLFTDAEGVKTISFTFLLILIAATIAVLVAKKHYFAAVALIISLIGIQFYNIRLSLEYIPAFIVCFALCPLYIMLEKRGDIFLTALSVVSGAMIAFFDFLTVETITILVPLAIVFIIRADENRLGRFKDNMMLMIKCGFCWGISYIMTYVVKWSAASIVCGENKFISAFSAAGIRLYGNIDEVNMPIYKQIPAAIAANLSTLFGGKERIAPLNILIGLIVSALILICLLLFFKKSKQNKQLTFTMLVLAVIPYLRYVVLNNHSYLHEFFTYRAQITVIICFCAIIWYNIDFRTLKRR